MNIREIEHYLGITDNDNDEYKENVVAEYREMKQQYPDLEFALTDDLGVYIHNAEIVKSGKYISAFIQR